MSFAEECFRSSNLDRFLSTDFTEPESWNQIVIPSIKNLPETCKCLVLYGEVGRDSQIQEVTQKNRISLNWFEDESENFNFLDPRILPDNTRKREDYLLRIVDTLLPKTCNEHSRDLLLAFLKMIVALKQETGEEASIPDLIDFKRGFYAEDIENIEKLGKNPIATKYLRLSKEIETYPEIAKVFKKHAEMNPAEQALSEGIVEESLKVFKNEAIQEKTRTSSFHPSLLRGKISQDCLFRHGISKYPETEMEWQIIRNSKHKLEWEGCTICLSTEPALRKEASILDSLFLDACGTYLAENPPNYMDNKGIPLGPYQCLFVLDNMFKLGRIASLPKNLGREKETQILYLIIGRQSLNRNFPFGSKQEQEEDEGKTSPLLDTKRILYYLKPHYSTEEYHRIENSVKAKILLGELNPETYYILTKEFPNLPIYIYHKNHKK